MSQKVTPTKAATIARVSAEYRSLDRLVRRMGPADFRRRVFGSETRESWTAKDALAHITAWKWNMQRALAKEPRPPGPRASTVAEANSRIYRRWHRRSAADVVADHRSAQRATLRTLRALPDEYFRGRAVVAVAVRSGGAFGGASGAAHREGAPWRAGPREHG